MFREKLYKRSLESQKDDKKEIGKPKRLIKAPKKGFERNFWQWGMIMKIDMMIIIMEGLFAVLKFKINYRHYIFNKSNTYFKIVSF